MNTGHLTEAELQQAADNNELLSTAQKQHLSQCANCQFKVENYRAIAVGLINMESPAFDFDLAGHVMAALPEKKVPYGWIPALAGGVGVLLIATAIAVFGSRLNTLFDSIPSSLLYVAIVPALVLLILQVIAVYKDYRDKMNTFINS